MDAHWFRWIVLEMRLVHFPFLSLVPPLSHSLSLSLSLSLLCSNAISLLSLHCSS
jgi:hypothetical protein